MFQNPAVPLAPMMPDAAVSAFNYLRAVEAGDTGAAAGFAGADPRMPALLVDVAARIVVPVTALCGLDPDPCDDSFALEAVGRVLAATLRRWAQAGPGAAGGIARAVIGFVARVLTEEDRGEVVAGVLRQLEAVGVGQALDAHPGSEPGLGTTRVRPNLVKVRSGGVRTGAVRNIECGAPWCARGCRASSSGAHQSKPPPTRSRRSKDWCDRLSGNFTRREPGRFSGPGVAGGAR
ncbi:hypothetical protein [Streptomyces sp. NBC_01320]|uniref:hypothetical protein n=1 Tax=Streptomyces sp. NBC_01320 TaxID=2903824 RepID=UPI002E1064FE|nr:hypothetical protein OG395_08260 [Streptomyces sp. NBC_01320]